MTPKNKELCLILFLALSVSVLILIKVFLFDGCYAFDTNDDVNHTFVNLKAAQDIMRQGEVPEINLYNNFGTPILGDALTFPFSLHSITYWFFPNYLAMTINRAIIAFLTIIFLFLFLRTFLSPISSFVSSILVFFAPGAFWNFAHHHYQMSLLCFVFILFIQTRYHKLKWFFYLFLLYLGYLTFTLSASIQLVVFAMPFLILFPLLKNGFREIKSWTLNIFAFLAAIIATWPQTVLFFQNISESTRANWSPYSGFFITRLQQVLVLFIPPSEWFHFGLNGHLTIATYFSVAFLIFALIGLIILFRKAFQNRNILLLCILLGLLPALAGYFVQFHLGKYIPYVRAVDATRIWWFSNIFLVLSIGKLIDLSWAEEIRVFFKILFGIIAAIILYFYFSIPSIIPEFSELVLLHRLVILGTALSLIILSISKFELFGKSLIITVLLLAQIPSFITILGLNLHSCSKGNHYFAQREEATFKPIQLLQVMEPGYRMASEESPVAGHDLKAIFGGILGSNARAIISKQKLQDLFVKKRLVNIDANYYFTSPWQEDLISKLGIRYLLLRSKNIELENKGWNNIGDAPNLPSNSYLYENSVHPSIAYLLKNNRPHFISDTKIIPNGVEILLPKIDSNSTLVLTFSYDDSWHALIDNKKILPEINELGMMHVPITPENKKVVFKFQRTSWIELFTFFLISIFLLISVSMVQVYAKK